MIDESQLRQGFATLLQARDASLADTALDQDSLDPEAELIGVLPWARTLPSGCGTS